MIVTVNGLTEQTIFQQNGNTFQAEGRDIRILARYEEPLVVLLGNVLSDEECDELIRLAKDRMKRSKIGSTREVDAIRTSSGMFFANNENDLIVNIEKRITKIMNVPVEHGDGLQILQYLPGQEYKAHTDYFLPTSQAAKNNRISTIVIYLNNVEQGGETVFPQLKLSVTPQKGTAVYFEYFYEDDNINKLTLHAGAPVITGEKWVATQWMRRQKTK
ncbi:2OG-Fe(II) oxygenase [Gottfriedia solisilvae]|uniref:2OG-Fe(II) oxygenase n=1 Tax=Gottfriedia solisilvae TaxID=1516104 RepID=UPI000B42DADB|nr:2OG-Fe(II) oxygenase [Gottfriedia solisilvae]